MARRASPRSGFSMIEILIVLVLAAIVAMGISRLMGAFFKQAKNTRTAVTASGFLADAIPLKKASQAWVKTMRDSGSSEVQASGVPEMLNKCMPEGAPADKAVCEDFMMKTPGFRLAGAVPPKVRQMANGKE